MLAHLRDAGNTIAVPISYHTGDEEEPETDEPTSSTPPEAARGKVPKNCPGAKAINAATGLTFEQERQTTQGGALLCDYIHDASNPDDLVFAGLGIGVSFLPDHPNQKQQFIDAAEQYVGPCRPITVSDTTAVCVSTNVDKFAQSVIATDASLAQVTVSGTGIAPPGEARPSWNAQDLAERASRAVATHLVDDAHHA